MKIVFCNIGWMKHYKGIDGDSLERGGKYNENAIGHEVCNFSDNKGCLYGYVRSGGNIQIEKIGADKNAEAVSGVTVVWTAGPESGGTVVIGWYKDATVYREEQTLTNPNQLQKKNKISIYRIVAPTKQAVLLPVEQRELIIPRAVKGGIGQSNVWYADKEESKALLESVVALIENGSSPHLPDVDELSVSEGSPRLLTHLRRERSPAIVKAKKEAVMRANNGTLCCEACGFDFKAVYGDIGNGFCEVHHRIPLSQADGPIKTELNDLAIVCSNCHRMIHRTNPMLDVDKLSKALKN